MEHLPFLVLVVAFAIYGYAASKRPGLIGAKPLPPHNPPRNGGAQPLTFRVTTKEPKP